MGKFLLRVFLLCVTVPFYATGQSADEKGELTIYPIYTQIGTIARRTLRNPQGRITREIFYTGNSLSHRPYTEEMLKVQSIILYKYNEQGRVSRQEYYNPSMQMEHVWVFQYDSNDQWRQTKLSPQGIKTYEIRFSGNSSVSHLYYDDRGEQLKAIRGQVPSDIDLPFGWGDAIQGLACGIVPVRERSLFAETDTDAICINIINSATDTRTLFQLPPPEIELRDARGRLVSRSSDPEKQEWLRRHSQLAGQTLIPGASAYNYPPYELRTDNARLAPGRYWLRIKQPVPELGKALISNVVFIDVKDRETPGVR